MNIINWFGVKLQNNRHQMGSIFNFEILMHISMHYKRGVLDYCSERGYPY